MATRSSILSWRIPWTEEPGGLQSRVTESQTRLSDWATTTMKVRGTVSHWGGWGHPGPSLIWGHFLGPHYHPARGSRDRIWAMSTHLTPVGCFSPIFKIALLRYKGFPGGSAVKNPPAIQEMQTRIRSLGREDPLEKEMATHSSILAWKIPWTEEPGRLQPMGSQRVGHDWATELNVFNCFLNIFWLILRFYSSDLHFEQIFLTDFNFCRNILFFIILIFCMATVPGIW